MGQLYIPEPRTYCVKCNTATKKLILYQEIIRQSEDDHFVENKIYQMIRCQGCDRISYRTFYSNPDYVGNDDGNKPYFFTIYPENKYSNFHPSRFDNLPEKIDDLYTEIVNCINQGNFILAVAGIRMILEATLKELNKKENKKHNFQQLIETMLEEKIISSIQAKLIHQIRATGNRTVHELEVMNLDDLLRIMPVIDNLLHLFRNEYSIKFNAIKRQRTSDRSNTEVFA